MYSKKTMVLFIVSGLFILYACNDNKANRDINLQEIEKTEKDFKTSIARLGVAEAFFCMPIAMRLYSEQMIHL